MKDEPLRIITPSAFTVEGYKALLRAGCAVDVHITHSVVSFPVGTTREELFPRMSNARYKLTLPDGSVLQEHCNRFTAQSLLLLPRTLCHPEEQEHLHEQTREDMLRGTE